MWVFPDAMRQLLCRGMTVYDARLAFPSVSFKHKKQGSLSGAWLTNDRRSEGAPDRQLSAIVFRA